MSPKMSLRPQYGSILIAIAALLWATDSLFRYTAVESLDSLLVVFYEHILALIILLPWAVSRRKKLLSMNVVEWTTAIFVGVGSSALGTWFFTKSFHYINPSVSILLQKLQPVLVVVTAHLVLRERPKNNFYPWAVIALASAVVLSFPDLRFDFLSQGLTLRSRGLLYALASMALWGFSTVASKVLLRRISATTGTFWHFLFGTVFLYPMVMYQSHADHQPLWTPLFAKGVFFSIFYLSSFAGVFAMIFYYMGLKRTTAWKQRRQTGPESAQQRGPVGQAMQGSAFTLYFELSAADKILHT